MRNRPSRDGCTDHRRRNPRAWKAQAVESRQTLCSESSLRCTRKQNLVKFLPGHTAEKPRPCRESNAADEWDCKHCNIEHVLRGLGEGRRRNHHSHPPSPAPAPDVFLARSSINPVHIICGLVSAAEHCVQSAGMREKTKAKDLALS